MKTNSTVVIGVVVVCTALLLALLINEPEAVSLKKIEYKHELELAKKQEIDLHQLKETATNVIIGCIVSQGNIYEDLDELPHDFDPWCVQMLAHIGYAVEDKLAKRETCIEKALEGIVWTESGRCSYPSSYYLNLTK